MFELIDDKYFIFTLGMITGILFVITFLALLQKVKHMHQIGKMHKTFSHSRDPIYFDLDNL